MLKLKFQYFLLEILASVLGLETRYIRDIRVPLLTLVSNAGDWAPMLQIRLQF